MSKRRKITNSSMNLFKDKPKILENDIPVIFGNKPFEYREVALVSIKVMPQVRMKIDTDDEDFKGLVESIKANGVLQPVILVKSAENDGYRLVAGERRYTAAKVCGLDIIPAIVYTELGEEDILSIQLAENLQRKDLSTYEKAVAFKRFLDTKFGEKVDTIKTISKLLINNEKSKIEELTCNLQVGISLDTILNYLRLFQFPQECIEIVKNTPDFPVNALKVLYKHKDSPLICEVFKAISEGKTTVKEAEQYLKRLAVKKPDGKQKRIRIYSRLRRLYNEVEELVKTDYMIKDKKKAQEIFNQLKEVLAELEKRING